MKIIRKLRLYDNVKWFHDANEYLQEHYGLTFIAKTHNVQHDDSDLQSKPHYNEIQALAGHNLIYELKARTINWFETPIYTYYDVWLEDEPGFLQSCFDIPDDNVAIMMRLALT